MRTAARTLQLLGCLVALAARSTAAETTLPTPQLADVRQALVGLPERAATLAFDAAGMSLPPGGHLQGVQACYDAAGERWLVFLSHDSLSVAYLLVVEWAAERADEISGTGRLLHVQRLPSDGAAPPLRHAGGIQLAGDVLAVGVEDNQDKRRSQVQFWNFANPAAPRQLQHLTVSRESQQSKQATAGAVGLLRRAGGDLLAVGNWDTRTIDFYVSNDKPLEDSACRFVHQVCWQAETAATGDWRPDDRRGTYQAINLIADQQGQVYLLGFDRTAAGQDVVDLFRVDLKRPAEGVLQKVERRKFQLGEGNQFRFAGGAGVHDGKLLLFSSPRNVQPTTTLSVLR